MPRIRFTAPPINAPRDSRTGGRRTPRDHARPEEVARSGRDMGTHGRSLAPGWWVLPMAVIGILFWAVVAVAISTRLF